MTLSSCFRQIRHTRTLTRVTCSAVLCICTMAACQSPQAPQPAVTELPSEVSTSATAESGATHQDSPFVTTSMGAAATGAENYNDLLKRYPLTKQAQIKAWYAKHAAGSMTFTSNAQWQWMRQHDYPTPDDVLLASMMSEAQLRDLATQGDTKANFFYLARLLDDYAQANEVSAATSRSKTQLRAELSASMYRALASGSAFAGYMFGDYYAVLHSKNLAGVGVAAGLVWADSLGDSNAVLHNRQAAMSFPGVSGVQAAEAYFDMFSAAARTNPYFQDARRGRGKPSIPIQ